MSKRKWEQINEVMDWFDFGKVAKTMKALDWKHQNLEGNFFVPLEGELREKARNLLSKTWDETERYNEGREVGTGGFYVKTLIMPEVEKDGYPGEDVIWIGLSFRVETWETW